MSKHKHTPGPWVVEEEITGDQSGLEGTVIIEPKTYTVIAQAKFDGEGDVSNGAYPHIAQAEANARLIAAAPDAVTLMQDLQEYLCEHGGVAVELLERVDAWVAKATGGDHE